MADKKQSTELYLDVDQKINLEYKVQAIEVEKEFIAVKQKVFMDGNLYSEQEYITTKEHTKEIKFIHSHIKKPIIHIEDMPKLYKKTVIEEIRKVPYYNINFSEFEIKNPFSYVQEYGNDNCVLLYCNNAEFKVTNIDGDLLPLAIFFDGESNGLTDEIYNIRQVGYLLRHRSDISFQIENKNDSVLKTIKRKEISRFHPPTVKEVSVLLPFIWSPSNADWLKYLDFCNGIKDLEGYKREFTNENSFILSNILGLDVAKREIANF